MKTNIALEHNQIAVTLPWSNKSLVFEIELIDNQHTRLYPEDWKKTSFNATDTSSQFALEAQLSLQHLFRPLRIKTKINICNITSEVKASITIHNPNAAEHPGGCWDLGDANSALFKEFRLNILSKSESVDYLTDANSDWVTTQKSLNIVQHSSGGENWQSLIHKDASGKVAIKINGYTVNDELSGSRAQPILIVNKSFSIRLNEFWQNFPSSIGIDTNQIYVGLIAASDDIIHELQPGEQKTRCIHLRWDDEAKLKEVTNENSTCEVSLPSESQNQLLPHCVNTAKEEPIQSLIATGLDEEKGFYAKRESIDEYGWRNYGDLYADHENHGKESPIVSHYNNQYDPIYGMLRQFSVTQDTRWFDLADSLARHVIDIDIYRTDDDRIQYNNGLFWHTDHYADAETATHRTYSKHQPKGIYDNHTGGGGPGGQHCYTTGLACYYFLTGNEDAKNTVIKMAEWVGNIYEKEPTLLGTLLGYKNRNNIGLKNIATGRYPLDRGTGNYIVALLDAFWLTNEQQYLDKAFLVIRNTVYLEDDLTTFDLKNIELCWFYIVYVQAITYFMHHKIKAEQFDERLDYAYYLLEKFAHWVCENETPYLDRIDELEFPNTTWAGQDFRKAYVLHYASHFAQSEENRVKFKAEGDRYYQYVYDTLKEDESLHYTRIQCLLMQSFGVKSYVETNPKTKVTFGPPPQLEKTKVKSLPRLLVESLKTTSPLKEWHWLVLRVGKVKAIDKKLRGRA